MLELKLYAIRFLHTDKVGELYNHEFQLLQIVSAVSEAQQIARIRDPVSTRAVARYRHVRNMGRQCDRRIQHFYQRRPVSRGVPDSLAVVASDAILLLLM